VSQVGEAVDFGFRKTGNGLCEELDSPGTRGLHQLYAFGSGFEADATGVFRRMTADQLGALEAGDDSAHRRGPDLLGFGEFAERARAAEDKNGQSRKLGRSDAAGEIANAKPAKQVNGGRVEVIGDSEGVAREGWVRWRNFAGATFVLDRGHGI
jgi:hypothetical protein